MKHAKDRVIALDYFRGMFMIMVLLNHALVFSLPFAMLAGAGILWTTAAEMFLLISGITFWIVRSKTVRLDFSGVMKKTLRRAAYIYALDILVVVASLLLSLYLSSHGLTNDVDGVAPDKQGIGLLADILTFKYTLGWANFLMYYSVFLLFAPVALYVLTTKLWAAVPLVSMLIFIRYSLDASQIGIYGTFAIWQAYFFLGLAVGRLRLPILGAYNKLSKRLARITAKSVAAVGCIVLTLSIFLEFNFYPTAARLTDSGWLPAKALGAYTHYLNLKPRLDHLFVNSRAGILRPFVAVLLLATFYIFYQKYKQPILKYSGKFVNSFGADTLWIFVAQAIAIPLIAALPISRNNTNNLILTLFLILSMWALTQRRLFNARFKAYVINLQTSYSEAKYAYLQRYDDGS
jgi:hypothetical protein